MALSASKTKIELREILLKDRPQSLYDISSKGTVPVLKINDNHIIDESLQIMIWAISQSKLNWITISPEEQYKLININDIDFKFWLNRYKYSDRFPEESLEYYQNKCRQILSSHDQILQCNKYFFANCLFPEPSALAINAVAPSRVPREIVIIIIYIGKDIVMAATAIELIFEAK